MRNDLINCFSPVVKTGRVGCASVPGGRPGALGWGGSLAPAEKSPFASVMAFLSVKNEPKWHFGGAGRVAAAVALPLAFDGYGRAPGG